jgi:leucyl-tRNA---protein transferase
MKANNQQPKQAPAIDQYGMAEQVSADEMDRLLAAGWRHFGAMFFRYSQREHQGQPAVVQPLRLFLPDFLPSQSQKRIIKRNRPLTVVIKPAFVSAEIEALFERHKQRFSDNVPQSIYGFVGENPATVPCNTQVVLLYAGQQLLAASYLDLAAHSASSIYSVFEPDASQHSLGIYLILCSIHYAQSLGKRWYYPGYAYNIPSHYDYKKRIGKKMYYLDWSSDWKLLGE